MKKQELMHLYGLASLVDDYLMEYEEGYDAGPPGDGPHPIPVVSSKTDYKEALQDYFGYLSGFLCDRYQGLGGGLEEALGERERVRGSRDAGTVKPPETQEYAEAIELLSRDRMDVGKRLDAYVTVLQELSGNGKIPIIKEVSGIEGVPDPQSAIEEFGVGSWNNLAWFAGLEPNRMRRAEEDIQHELRGIFYEKERAPLVRDVEENDWLSYSVINQYGLAELLEEAGIFVFRDPGDARYFGEGDGAALDARAAAEVTGQELKAAGPNTGR